MSIFRLESKRILKTHGIFVMPAASILLSVLTNDMKGNWYNYEYADKI